MGFFASCLTRDCFCFRFFRRGRYRAGVKGDTVTFCYERHENKVRTVHKDTVFGIEYLKDIPTAGLPATDG